MNFCCMVHNAKRGGIGLGSAVRFVICHIKDEKGRRNEGREWTEHCYWYQESICDVTELDELVLAYATTIHKAQGSEYPIVVMPFTMSHYVMLQRNLLYTGVTRAKKILVLVGEKKAVGMAIKNEKTSIRNTKLSERLRWLIFEMYEDDVVFCTQKMIVASTDKEKDYG